MGELRGLYAIWWRELKVYVREPSRVVSSIATPLVWLFLFGFGLGAFVELADISYEGFIYPGLIVMATVFGTIFFGLYIVYDRKMDVLKEVLAAPLRRTTIFLGKAVGGSTEALIIGSILLVFGVPLAGIDPLGALPALAILFVVALSTVSIGLAIGTLFESPEGFQMIVSFLILPLVFLSGAFYPLRGLASDQPLLYLASVVNPLTYGVDAMRGLLLGVHFFPLWIDVAAVLGFAAAMMAVGTVAFHRMD